jgi:hypothetical protein
VANVPREKRWGGTREHGAAKALPVEGPEAATVVVHCLLLRDAETNRWMLEILRGELANDDVGKVEMEPVVRDF